MFPNKADFSGVWTNSKEQEFLVDIKTAILHDLSTLPSLYLCQPLHKKSSDFDRLWVLKVPVLGRSQKGVANAVRTCANVTFCERGCERGYQRCCYRNQPTPLSSTKNLVRNSKNPLRSWNEVSHLSLADSQNRRAQARFLCVQTPKQARLRDRQSRNITVPTDLECSAVARVVDTTCQMLDSRYQILDIT